MLCQCVGRPFVVVEMDQLDVAVQLELMSPSSIGSCSVDPSLLSPPTGTPVPPSVFYSHSTRNRPVTPPPSASIPTSTPISNKTSGNHSYASETHDRESANYCLAQETSGLFLGAMFSTRFFQSLAILNNIQSPWGISRKFWTHLKRSTCTPHLLAYS